MYIHLHGCGAGPIALCVSGDDGVEDPDVPFPSHLHDAGGGLVEDVAQVLPRLHVLVVDDAETPVDTIGHCTQCLADVADLEDP